MRNKFENITILHSSNRFHFSFNYFNFRMRVCLLPHRSKFRSVPRHAKVLKQSLNVPNINSQIELKLNFSFLTECAAGWREFSPGTSKAKTEIQKKKLFPPLHKLHVCILCHVFSLTLLFLLLGRRKVVGVSGWMWEFRKFHRVGEVP